MNASKQHVPERRVALSPDRRYQAGVPAGLAEALARLARSLEQEGDTEETLEGIVRAAIELIPGVEEASISVVVERHRVNPLAVTSEVARRIDEVQSETGEGPCLDAIYEKRTVSVPDMRSEKRWPHFAQRAFELGAGSMLSLQMYVEHDNLGALNLFASRPRAFDEESEYIALLFAAHAAVAMAGIRMQQQLSNALTSRDAIGQAKGILMERHTITGDTAFKVLSRYSQEQNIKLREVAEHLVRQCEAEAKNRSAH